MLISTVNSEIIQRCRISDRKLQLIVRCFATDCTASQAASLSLVNYNTAKRYYRWLRLLVINQALIERHQARITNGIEIDESYFGPKRQKGKRGRGAGNKIVVLGLLKRGGKVYCEIISKASREEIMPIVRATVRSGADIYTDGWRSYDALAIYGYNHKKVNHEQNEFARAGTIHINGVESFWSCAKRRLAKFNGVSKQDFPIYLLESEWRFNHRGDILEEIRRLIRRYRKSHSI